MNVCWRARYADAAPTVARYCARRVEDGYEVEAIRKRLGLRRIGIE
jgi:hypothetical protein